MAKAPRGEMTFLEHFEDLRKCLYRAVLGVIATFAVCTYYLPEIMKFLVAPYFRYLPQGQQSLAYTEITEVFFLYMKVAFVGSLFASAPWIFYQLWVFISPGLRPQERKYALPFILGTSAFFMAGMAFCYYAVLPYTFKFFFEFNKQFTNIVTVSNFWDFEMKFLLGIGLTFETPILILFLTRLGLVTPMFLLKKFKWAVLLAFVASAVITPSGDPVNQTIVAVPIIVLYAIGVGISFLFQKRQEPEQKPSA